VKMDDPRKLCSMKATKRPQLVTNGGSMGWGWVHALDGGGEGKKVSFMKKRGQKKRTPNCGGLIKGKKKKTKPVATKTGWGKVLFFFCVFCAERPPAIYTGVKTQRFSLYQNVDPGPTWEPKKNKKTAQHKTKWPFLTHELKPERKTTNTQQKKKTAQM